MSTIVKTWNLLTVNNIPYIVEISSDGLTFLQLQNMPAIPIDPAQLETVLAEVMDSLAELSQTVCPVTLTLTTETFTDTLTCDLPAGHDSTFHHEPRGFYWYTSS